MAARKLKVLIIGCGNIAGRFDMSDNELDFPYTHAGAYSRDKRFTIVACVEPDRELRIKFLRYWNIPVGFLSLEQAIAELDSIDVVSVCSPTSCHRNDVLNSLQLSPKLIFCEKPVAETSEETLFLIRACEEVKVRLAVNYSRRWDPTVAALKETITNNKYGALRAVVGYYNKGILNNGSHLIDLLYYLLSDLEIVATGDRIYDFNKNDPSLPVMLRSSNCNSINLIATNANDFSLFEIQFIFARTILTMKEGGLCWHLRTLKSSDVFAEYQVFDEGHEFKGEYPSVMVRAIDNIYQTLTSDEPLACTGDFALRAQNMCEAIVNGNIRV